MIAFPGGNKKFEEVDDSHKGTVLMIFSSSDVAFQPRKVSSSTKRLHYLAHHLLVSLWFQ